MSDTISSVAMQNETIQDTESSFWRMFPNISGYKLKNGYAELVEAGEQQDLAARAEELEELARGLAQLSGVSKAARELSQTAKGYAELEKVIKKEELAAALLTDCIAHVYTVMAAAKKALELNGLAKVADAARMAEAVQSANEAKLAVFAKGFSELSAAARVARISHAFDSAKEVVQAAIGVVAAKVIISIANVEKLVSTYPKTSLASVVATASLAAAAYRARSSLQTVNKPEEARQASIVANEQTQVVRDDKVEDKSGEKSGTFLPLFGPMSKPDNGKNNGRAKNRTVIPRLAN